MMRTRIVCLISIAALVCTAACQKRAERPEPPSSTQAPPPAASAPVSVVRIDLGTALNPDKSVATATQSFKPTDTIYASIATAGSAPAATLAIRWTYENGQLVSESSQSIAPTGPANSEFHIAKPDGWPLGTYAAHVTLDGVAVGSKSFEVK